MERFPQLGRDIFSGLIVFEFLTHKNAGKTEGRTKRGYIQAMGGETRH